MVLRAPERRVDSARIIIDRWGPWSRRWPVSVAWVARNRWATRPYFHRLRGLGQRVGRALGSVRLFGFLAVYLAAAAAAWGWRRAVAFTAWAGGLAFTAEWSLTRTGIPFGLYHYTGATAGRSFYVSNVPLSTCSRFSRTRVSDWPGSSSV